jgi:peptidoglycan/xylan/chitin deacetylase (PgdA/CDA1 family)
MNRHKHKTKLTTLLLFFVLFPGNIDWGQCQELWIKKKIVSEFSGKVPREWGETIKGPKTRLSTDQRVIALTFDACGGQKGSGYDAQLINFLTSEAIPATLFISSKWIDANPDIFQTLARNPLFEIENHGLNHNPCSVNGRSVYGIKGTRGIGELVDEIEQKAIKIQTMTGHKPKYYRSGTVYCDEIGVEAANALGYEVVSFSVRRDAGATYSKQQVKEALLKASPSAIVLLHMNHPESETAEGVIEAIPQLRKLGFNFVKLSDYSLR